jgi:predicted ArsR family transcriptional regulator
LFLLLFVPVGIVLLGFALYFTSKGLPELRAAIAADRERRLIQMIEARGEVTLTDLADELGIRVEACDDLVEAALKSERFFGWHDAARGRVYSAKELRERQTRLAAIVTARGQIHMDDLAHELSAPRELTRTWMYELVKRGEFTGYINWDEGVLYSREARRLTDAGRCPHCNGELSLAGKGVIRCRYCSSEIFL